MPILLFIIVSLALSSEVSVASYNVENLFDLRTSGLEYTQYTPSIDGWNLKAYRSKLANCASVITELNPDIIALQEIENPEVLDALSHECEESGSIFPYSFFGEDTLRRSTGVAILSKYPLSMRSVHPVVISEESRSRNFLECIAETNIGDLRLIIMHWPSKRNAESHRIAAALRVKEIIDTLPLGCEYLVLGDFNSCDDEADRLLTEDFDDRNGVTGINHILQTSNSSVGEPLTLNLQIDVINSDKNLLYNPWSEQSGTDRYSYRYQGELLAIDHILLPKSLLDSSGLSYVQKSFSHFTMYGALTRNLTPYRWQKSFGEHHSYSGEGYSDHLPISLKLTNETTHHPHNREEIVSGSFEKTKDGWSIRSANFYSIRSTEQAVDGIYSLKIIGEGVRNGVMASLTAIIPEGVTQCELSLAGEGEYSIRVSSSRKNDWSYLVGTELKGSASQSYSIPPKQQWVKRIIPLHPYDPEDTIDIELRYRGGIPHVLYIDDCNLSGWFRPQ